ncbi:uncharacterized protein LOC133777865 isoform X1 [Humulus lupulus]|uniref:uncharacterized protein LOC133777865 isoform X1 n=1 Tax=Humulus lupulus TaxID=3486 RepID=UPI002B412C86|nr:uncharacterized protein LOC133777865 isoform X1 [Humulus lupulus]XP_062073602.1 uncharacterized protein LOC133777865 isoform X1 [Humulus lupulus]XP_062073603.1 uncharacterized protein LOC133777865 isoform X1 [Humulus lupulus]
MFPIGSIGYMSQNGCPWNSTRNFNNAYHPREREDINAQIENLSRTLDVLQARQTQDDHREINSAFHSHHHENCSHPLENPIDFSWKPEYNYYASSHFDYNETNDVHAYENSSEIPFDPTYNPNSTWSQNMSPMNHVHQFNTPNLGYAQPDLSYPPQPKINPSLEDTLQQFMQSTQQILHHQSQSLLKIETQMSQLATFMIESEKQVLPSQPTHDPLSQNESEKMNEVVGEPLISIQPILETKKLDEMIVVAHDEKEKDIVVFHEPIVEPIYIFTQSPNENKKDVQFSYFIEMPPKLHVSNYFVGVMLSILIYGICINIIVHPTNEILHHRLGVG